MRIQFRITPPSLFIPISYRKMVLSAIKELIKQAEPSQYNYYFANNTMKPYCFSVYLPKPEFIKSQNQFKIAEPRLDVTFSTADWGDIALLHNGLLKVQQQANSEIRYKNYPLKIGKILLCPEFRIETNVAKFKTLSPIVLRRTKNEASSIHTDPQTRLFEDGLEVFNQELNHAMTPLIKHFLGKEIPFSFHPVDGQFKETIMRVQDEGEKSGVLFGHKGVFELEGSSEVLNLLSQTGLGSRRGYGLGCIEQI